MTTNNGHQRISSSNYPLFYLDKVLTQEQKDFFDKYGFLHFKNFISKETVSLILQESEKIQQEWIEADRKTVNGVPIKYGFDVDGKKIVQRFAFTNHFSSLLDNLLKDERFKSLFDLIGTDDVRIGEHEKDGLVFNHYVNTSESNFSQMGWHTDAPRDLFLGQKIMPMLNVGIHLDECKFENGGLRVLPGTHKQNVLKLLFGKKYFIDNNDDSREVGFDLHPGDLSVHDGRLWHRVKQSPKFGEESRRRVMYIPFVTGKYKPKDENSKTPFYHRFTAKVHH